MALKGLKRGYVTTVNLKITLISSLDFTRLFFIPTIQQNIRNIRKGSNSLSISTVTLQKESHQSKHICTHLYKMH